LRWSRSSGGGVSLPYDPIDVTQYTEAELRAAVEAAENRGRYVTSTNAELLALSGPRNPYPGKLGVVEEGALADLLLVDGDPIANLQLVSDLGADFLPIMKDGRIYKDTLPRVAPP
jgi:imidazolonepropionase-like amidohydrolase